MSGLKFHKPHKFSSLCINLRTFSFLQGINIVEPQLCLYKSKQLMGQIKVYLIITHFSDHFSKFHVLVIIYCNYDLNLGCSTLLKK